MQCYRGAKLFNPLVSQGLWIQELEALVEDLTIFKFVTFTPAFLARLKKEHYMKEAVHLVVLVQVSSVAVERRFSRLRLILESTQEGVLHDAITIRLFNAVNSKNIIYKY
jgi:hypothetical protein